MCWRWLWEAGSISVPVVGFRHTNTVPVLWCLLLSPHSASHSLSCFPVPCFPSSPPSSSVATAGTSGNRPHAGPQAASLPGHGPAALAVDAELRSAGSRAVCLGTFDRLQARNKLLLPQSDLWLFSVSVFKAGWRGWMIEASLSYACLSKPSAGWERCSWAVRKPGAAACNAEQALRDRVRCPRVLFFVWVLISLFCLF